MAQAGLSQEEAFARIRLLRSPRIGPVSYAQLLRRFGTAVKAVEALPDLARRGGGRYSTAPAEQVEQEIAAARAAGARYLFRDSPDYPQMLKEMENAPPIVTWRGDLRFAASPCVAVVGARNASAAAVKLAREFSAALAGEGFTIVSGLARGIDGAAHQGALDAGESGRAGGTIGVIASGIEIAYPPQHAALQERIATEGLLIAEQPPGTQPRGPHFPSRNRIIAGLSLGTLVVEAAPKSGSLITARLAGEAGREVMAIPGSPLEPRSLGCNQLIREGAVLVQSPTEVAELLQGFTGQPRASLREAQPQLVLEEGEMMDEEPADISALLTTAPIGVDELIRQSGQSPGAVQMALLEMEIAGRLVRHAGDRVSLAA